MCEIKAVSVSAGSKVLAPGSSESLQNAAAPPTLVSLSQKLFLLWERRQSGLGGLW